MTQAQFDGLKVGDTVVKHSTGKQYIVQQVFRGRVWAQTIRNGKGFGRGYEVKTETWSV